MNLYEVFHFNRLCGRAFAKTSLEALETVNSNLPRLREHDAKKFDVELVEMATDEKDNDERLVELEAIRKDWKENMVLDQRYPCWVYHDNRLIEGAFWFCRQGVVPRFPRCEGLRGDRGVWMYAKDGWPTEEGVLRSRWRQIHKHMLERNRYQAVTMHTVNQQLRDYLTKNPP